MTRIQQLRLMHNIPIKVFASDMGVGDSTVYKWETDLMLPTAENLMKMADLYDVSVDYILGRDKSETEYETLLRAVEIMRNMRQTK